MEDSKPPLVFANRVIRKVVDNLLGDGLSVIPDDYVTMRVVFRKLGGSWQALSQGDIHQNQLIVRVVQAWGNIRGKARKIEEGY